MTDITSAFVRHMDMEQNKGKIFYSWINYLIATLAPTLTHAFLWLLRGKLAAHIYIFICVHTPTLASAASSSL